MDLLILQKLVVAALLPPGGFVSLLCISLLLSRRAPKAGIALVVGSTILLFALSVSPVASWLIAPLERTAALSLTDTRLADRQAIVVLGGGRRSYAPEFGGETVSALTLERTRYGAWLQRKLQLPLAVTGGVPIGEGVAEAQLMARVLRDDFSVPVRWLESRSRTTRENAIYTRQMLTKEGIERIVLVSHAIHLTRAETMFTDQGFDVVSAPTAFLRYARPSTITPLDFVPSAMNFWRSWYALHEHLGRLWYWLRK